MSYNALHLSFEGVQRRSDMSGEDAIKIIPILQASVRKLEAERSALENGLEEVGALRILTYRYVGPPPSRNGKRVSGNPVPKFAPGIPKRSGASCTKGSFCVIGENIVLLLLLLCAACNICDS